MNNITLLQILVETFKGLHYIKWEVAGIYFHNDLWHWIVSSFEADKSAGANDRAAAVPCSP